MAKTIVRTKRIVRRDWTRAEVKELKQHSKNKTRVKTISKAATLDVPTSAAAKGSAVIYGVQGRPCEKPGRAVVASTELQTVGLSAERLLSASIQRSLKCLSSLTSPSSSEFSTCRSIAALFAMVPVKPCASSR